MMDAWIKTGPVMVWWLTAAIADIQTQTERRQRSVYQQVSGGGSLASGSHAWGGTHHYPPNTYTPRYVGTLQAS